MGASYVRWKCVWEVVRDRTVGLMAIADCISNVPVIVLTYLTERVCTIP